MHGSHETQPGLVKGKWQYFSPEQAYGEALDGRSDLFACGTVLYRLLCNRLPFAGSSPQAIRAITRGEYPPPVTINPTLPTELTAIITRALEVGRDRRFADAATMEAALRTHLVKTDPSFSMGSLSSFVRWLFEEDLQTAGLTLTVPPDARREFEGWLAQSRPALAAAVENAGTRSLRPGASRSALAQLRDVSPWLGLLAALGAAGTLAWWLR